MKDRRLIGIIGVFLCILARPATGEVAGPPAEDLHIVLRRTALQGLIAAATPYQVDVGSSLLRENLIFR